MWLKPSFEPRQTIDFAFGIEPHAEFALSTCWPLRAADWHDAQRLAIAVVARVAGGLGQLFDDQFLGRIRGIAHAQVDHVVAGPPLLVLERVDPGEQVWRQPLDPVGHLDLERRGLSAGLCSSCS